MTLFREITFWFVFSVMAAAAVRFAYLALVGRRNDGRPRCPRCWYDMTGAPSLTCPECGHDAGHPRRLTARRRNLRRLVDVAGILLLLWYALLVRDRMHNLTETPHTAMTPTTYFIARSAMADVPIEVQDTVCERFFGHSAPEPRVSQWQVWLESWALYHSLKAQPPTGLRDARMELLHRLTFHSDVAKREWTKLIVTSDPSLANAMLSDLGTPRSQHLRSPAMRQALCDRYRKDLNSVPDLNVLEWMLSNH